MGSHRGGSGSRRFHRVPRSGSTSCLWHRGSGTGRTKAIRLTISLIKSGGSLKSFGGYTYYILPLQLINLNV